MHILLCCPCGFAIFCVWRRGELEQSARCFFGKCGVTPALFCAAKTYRPSIKSPGFCFSFLERLSVCLGVFPANPPFPFRTLCRNLKKYSQCISHISSGRRWPRFHRANGGDKAGQNEIMGKFNLCRQSTLYCRNPGSTTLKQRQ